MYNNYYSLYRDVGGDDVNVLVGIVHLPVTPLQGVVQLQRRIAYYEVDERVPQVNFTLVWNPWILKMVWSLITHDKWIHGFQITGGVVAPPPPPIWSVLFNFVSLPFCLYLNKDNSDQPLCVHKSRTRRETLNLVPLNFDRACLLLHVCRCAWGCWLWRVCHWATNTWGGTLPLHTWTCAYLPHKRLLALQQRNDPINVAPVKCPSKQSHHPYS
jgi:hypothetical protein